MKRLCLTLLLFVELISSPIFGQPGSPQPTGKNNLAYKWSVLAMDCTADDTEKFKPRPTVTSRYLGLIWTAVFDEWSRFDDKTIPVYLKNVKRKLAAERTLRNKEIAISYPSHRAMIEYSVFDSIMLLNKMNEFGFDLNNKSLDLSPAVRTFSRYNKKG